NVMHSSGKIRIGGDLNNRSYGIASWSTQASRKQNNIGPGGYLSCHTFDVIAWRALEVESRFGGVFRIIEHCSDWRSAAFTGCARGFHRIRQQTVLDIPRRRIHVEA